MNQTMSPAELDKAGKKAFQVEAYEDAAQSFQAAAEGFRLAGDALAAAEMQNNRSVALLKTGDHQGAYQAVIGTPETFAEAGDVKRQAMALGNLAAALEALEHTSEAEQAYLQSAELLAQSGEDELRATVMRSLSELQLRTGRHLEAVASLHAGLEGLKKPKPRQRLIKRLLEMPFKLLNRS